jgi:nitrous oxidase accessory protein
MGGAFEMRWCLVILFLMASQAYAATIHVGKQYKYKSVAFALSVTSPGDTIFVHEGEYHEKNLIISKPITLKGIGRPVLDGDGKFEIISIKASYVTIDGFLLRNSGISSMVDYAAIKIINCSNVTIQNNEIVNCFFGIYVEQGNRCLVLNNKLRALGKAEQQSGNGIHCWKSDKIRLVANNITGHRDGIYFEFVTNSVIWGNRSYQNLRYGLHFMFSNDDSYVSNTFEENGAGVAVMFSKGINMYRNHFSRNWGDAAYGILLKEISDSKMEENVFEHNTSAIYAEGASRILMKKNTFQSNGWAIKIQASCMDISVESNNFLGNTFDVATNGSLVLNNFKNNYWDKYEGYDLNRDNIGDIPYRPISMYSMIVERNPSVMMLFHSFITTVMDKSEKVIPSLTPENLKDEYPLMKALRL